MTTIPAANPSSTTEAFERRQTPQGPLAGQVVILNGAGGGIGRAVAALLATQGVSLAITDCNQQSLQATSDHIHGTDAAILADVVDAADSDRVAHFAARVLRELGPVYGLINCFGLFEVTPYDEIIDSSWERVLRSNLTATYVTCRQILPTMVQRRQGSVVNFASAAGEFGSIRPASHYAAAKGGVIAYSKSLAREVSPLGVRVNVLSPGPIDTSMFTTHDPSGTEAVRALTLFNRLGTPAEIAQAARFLVGPESSYITGHVLRVNGGALL